MAERDEEHDSIPRHVHIRVEPVERVIKAGGFEEVIANIHVSGMHKEDVDAAIELLSEGGKSRKGSPGSSSSFAFTRWADKAWEPKGPGKNWGWTPPADPSLN